LLVTGTRSVEGSGDSAIFLIPMSAWIEREQYAVNFMYT
jgi:hypothetical protein